MNEKQDPFEALRRLLALKRHEVPPPGFFDHFSRDVVARLRAGETGTQPGWWARLFPQGPQAARLWETLQTKPVLAGGFTVVLCALLLAAAIYAQQPEATPEPLFRPEPASRGLASVSTFPFDQAANSSTNPVLGADPMPAPSLFNQINRLTRDTQPVETDYSPNGQ